MNYPKPALAFADQAGLLTRRGLAGDPLEIAERLAAVSYYRLSAYWYPFRLPDDSLRPGTSMDAVWRRYVFDRQLRLLVLDAIERVEIAIRTLVVNQHSLLHGPFGYLDRANLPNLTPADHGQLLRRLRDAASRSREDFVSHFFGKYTSETELPLWMVCELMTFGGLLTLFRGLATPLKQSISRSYGVSDSVLDSWLLAINQIRNLCAHHARLWNRVLGVKPMIPRQRKHPQWHVPVAIPDDRIFGCLTVLRYLLRETAPSSQWQARLQSLLTAYPEIPTRDMGFPADWIHSPLWQP